MTAAKLVILLLQVSIVLMVLGLGLKATFQDVGSFLRHPGKLARSLLVMNVIMPTLAIFLATASHIPLPVKIALLVLAVSPVPPFLPTAQFKLGGGASYIYGLLATTSLLAILFVPLTMMIMAKLFHLDLRMSPQAVAGVVMLTVLAPLGIGMLVRFFAPAFADRAAKWVSQFATVLLLAGTVCLLVFAWSDMLSLIGNGTLLTMIVFVLAGLVAGYLLGGRDPGERTSLALATASRHPAVALAIAKANFSDEKLIFAAILLYLLVNALVSIPFKRWIRKHGLLNTSTPAHPMRHRTT